MTALLLPGQPMDNPWITTNAVQSRLEEPEAMVLIHVLWDPGSFDNSSLRTSRIFKRGECHGPMMTWAGMAVWPATDNTEGSSGTTEKGVDDQNVELACPAVASLGSSGGQKLDYPLFFLLSSPSASISCT
ncbi:hypothetical protein BS78_05G184200 [Paspalum vaginatum]|nr:hypothetical protein BS78_05G184200 [Paspalum vaginatum]